MSNNKRISRESIINKTSLINPQGSSAGGFTCNVCSASFTVYDAYLDHCNSRLHLKNAGLAPVERVDDVERIRERLAYLRRKRENQRASGDGGGGSEENAIKRVEDRIAQRRMQEEQKRQEQRRKAASKRETTEDTHESPDEEAALMASVLGISSFK